MYPPLRVNQKQVAAAVKRAEKALKPDVVRIRYSFDSDWVGDDSIFFRVVLSDGSARKKDLGGMVRRVIDTIDKKVNTDEMGLHRYFNFRSLSETKEVKDPDWEA